MKHPFIVPKQKPLYYHLFNPGTIGCLTAAAFAALPRVPGRSLLPEVNLLPDKLDNVVGAIPSRVYAMLLGFMLGFSLSKGVGWARLKALRALFSYHGWVHGSSSKTKVNGRIF